MCSVARHMMALCTTVSYCRASSVIGFTQAPAVQAATATFPRARSSQVHRARLPSSLVGQQLLMASLSTTTCTTLVGTWQCPRVVVQRVTSSLGAFPHLHAQMAVLQSKWLHSSRALRAETTSTTSTAAFPTPTQQVAPRNRVHLVVSLRRPTPTHGW